MLKKTKVGLSAAAAVALSLGLVAPAMADVQGRGTDVVGIGSDTAQYPLDFMADGDVGGDAGYNTVNTARRVLNFDATGDASGRTAYQNGTSTALASSVVLHGGTKPVTRPNGSGAGITALLNDTGAQRTIDYVRSSRLPKAAEVATASDAAHTTAGFGGGIHVYQFATDGLDMATNLSSPNADTSLAGADLVNIYTGVYKKWSDVPGYAGAAPNDGIIPILPQTGSGTRNDFLADLQNNFNGGVALTLASDVVTAEEHDPTAITSVTAHTDINGNPVTKDDAIEPFSTGRFNLINTGYFGTTPAPNTITLQTGVGSYHLARFLYIIMREADVSSATPFQVGGTLNWVKTLFGTATSYIAKSSNAPLLASAGVTQAWVDKGLNAHTTP